MHHSIYFLTLQNHSVNRCHGKRTVSVIYLHGIVLKKHFGCVLQASNLLSVPLGLLDYPTLIKRPMDFGTIKKKVKNQEYSTLYACGDDVRLIWNNCMTYNADGSDFYKLAQSLYKKWDTQWMKFLQEVGSAPAPGEPLAGGHEKVTLQEKKNFAKMLFQISKEDLGKVLLEVERKCPAAIVRNASEDELDFNLDLLDAATLSELTILVQSYVFFILLCFVVARPLFARLCYVPPFHRWSKNPGKKKAPAGGNKKQKTAATD
jgi:Bromodomain/Bromodomain extra-terminal - transcription regulation